MGESREISNMGCESGKSKQLAKGNREEMPHESNSNCHEGGTQWLSESVCVSIHMYCTFVLLNTLPLHYFPSLWEFFSAKPKGQGPSHWPLA